MMSVLRNSLWMVGLLSTCLVSASSSFSAVVPCGGGVDSTRHAVVPDKSCQPIDPQGTTGAFSIVQLANSGDAKIAFSSTPDCAKVFVPTREQLTAHQEGGSCVELHAEGESQPLRYVILVTGQ